MRDGVKTRWIACAALMAAATGHGGPAQASDRAWSQASTAGAGILVGAALGVPLVKGDGGGLAQAAESIGIGGGIAYGLKQVVPEWRPDHSDRKGFPSAHSSVAFSAAATLYNRYGWEVGLPAHLLALFVGTARVEAHKHRWRDVAAGAAIGEASGLLLTQKADDRVRLTPWADLHGGGIALAARF